MRASNALADGDPVPNKIKQLRIVYHDGVREAVAVTNEGQSISIAAAPLPGEMKVEGPWSVAFPHGFAPNAHAKGSGRNAQFRRVGFLDDEPLASGLLGPVAFRPFAHD